MNDKMKAIAIGSAIVCLCGIGTGAYGLYTGANGLHSARVWEGRYNEVLTRAQFAEDELTMLRKANETAPVKIEELIISVKDVRETKSIQNRNPGNVKTLGKKNEWKGAIGLDDQGHVIFKNMAWGLRAMALTLLAYETKHGINTVEALIKRYCTSNHKAYIAHINKALRLKPGQKFSIRKRLPELMTAMIRFESGYELPAQYKDILSLIRL